MNIHRLTSLTVLVLWLSAISVSAQNNYINNRAGAGHVRNMLGENVSITDSVNVYKALSENIPIDNEFTNEPVFAIVGKNQSFYFSIGANLKFTACYDMGNPSDDPSGIAVGQIFGTKSGDHQNFQMTAQGSNVYFNIIGFPQSNNRVGFFVSFATNALPGNTYRVKASYVYLRFHDFLVGYSTSIYNDRAADPYTIDGHGPVASGSHDDIQLSMQKYFTRHLRVGVGIEGPKADYCNYIPAEMLPDENYLGMVHQRIPDIPFYVSYHRDRISHIRLSCILRGLTYRDYIQGRTLTVPGWGAKLTASWQFGPIMAYGQTQIGRGISSYIHDNSGLGLDLVPDMNRPGRLRTSLGWGCIGGMEVNWSQRFFSSFIYSYMRNYIHPYANNIGYSYPEQLDYSQYALCNLIWKITPLFRTGIEYVYGRRNNYNGIALSNSRIAAMLTMSF